MSFVRCLVAALVSAMLRVAAMSSLASLHNAVVMASLPTTVAAIAPTAVMISITGIARGRRIERGYRVHAMRDGWDLCRRVLHRRARGHRSHRRTHGVLLAHGVAMPGFLTQHEAHQAACEQHRRHRSRLDSIQARAETVNIPHDARRPRSCPAIVPPGQVVARTMPVRTGAYHGDDAAQCGD